MTSFDAASEISEISEIFRQTEDNSSAIKPTGKVLPPYDRSLENTAATAASAAKAELATLKTVKTDLFVKTDATGVLFFQALQDQWLLGEPIDKAQIGSAMGPIITSSVGAANNAIANSRLLAAHYLGLIEKAVVDHHYEYLTHIKPSKPSAGLAGLAGSAGSAVRSATVAPAGTALIDSVGFGHFWGGSNTNSTAKIADGVAKRFDYIVGVNDPSVDRMWMARLSNGAPLSHEWAIAPGLVGVAMPSEMFQHFAEQASIRAALVESEKNLAVFSSDADAVEHESECEAPRQGT